MKNDRCCFQGHRDQILATAETRERRQRKLEHFFREAYAITFGLTPGERRRRAEDTDPEVEFKLTTLRFNIMLIYPKRIFNCIILVNNFILYSFHIKKYWKSNQLPLALDLSIFGGTDGFWGFLNLDSTE